MLLDLPVRPHRQLRLGAGLPGRHLDQLRDSGGAGRVDDGDLLPDHRLRSRNRQCASAVEEQAVDTLQGSRHRCWLVEVSHDKVTAQLPALGLVTHESPERRPGVGEGPYEMAADRAGRSGHQDHGFPPK